jgi:hypothetical protein
MRLSGKFLIAIAFLSLGGAAYAAERGNVIRPGQLKAQPFIDAATAADVAANQSVTILARRGGWVQVESNGKQGWLRMLNVRLEANAAAQSAAAAAKPKAGVSPASLFRTGSSRTTVTTGVKGIGEEDIQKAAPDPVQLAALATLAVPDSEAAANAQQSGLKENTVDYLDKKDAK